MELKDRVAFVTGSSRGIGAGIAARFAALGARVAVHGRDAGAVATVCEQIAAAGGRAIGVTGDVTRFEDLEDARRRIEAELGPIDIVVTNAGGSATPPGPIEALSEDGWRASVEGNLTSTFLTIKSVLPGMKARRRGSIITMSSSAAGSPTARSPAPYAAAKAGIETLTRILAAQAGEHGIRANCIAPGTILTERNLQRIPADLQVDLAAAHALRRLGTPADVAGAAAFLASDDAARITGIVLPISGGGHALSR
jgi:3-oxoacyl-[acyl-carrier protein] reductase